MLVFSSRDMLELYAREKFDELLYCSSILNQGSFLKGELSINSLDDKLRISLDASLWTPNLGAEMSPRKKASYSAILLEREIPV